MKYLFCCGRSYLPETIGGIQVNTDALCRALILRGHSVVVLSGRAEPSFAQKLKMKVTRGRSLAGPDLSLGYPVYRLTQPETAVDELLAREEPDRVVVQSIHMAHYADAARRVGSTAHAYFHAACDYDIRDARDVAFASVIANSKYVAAWIRERFGVDARVVRPLVEPDRYRVAGAGSNVLFVNPHPSKGGWLALEIAATLPDVQFDFVECWFRNDSVAEVRRQARGLRNVRWHEPRSDLRPLYARARLLIVPSRDLEGWGRVVTEAQVSGIPVVASSIGGLPEAVGRGGVLLDAEAGSEAWARVVKHLLDNEGAYRTASELARLHSERDEVSPDRVVSDLLAVLEGVGGGTSGR